MGFVGAGGIGMDLIEAIRKFYYSDVSAILLMIVITVGVIDTLTEHGSPSPDRPAGAALMRAHGQFDLAAIRDRHPHHFGRPGRDRRLLVAAGAGAFVLLLGAMALPRLLRRQVLRGHRQAGRDRRA